MRVSRVTVFPCIGDYLYGISTTQTGFDVAFMKMEGRAVDTWPKYGGLPLSTDKSNLLRGNLRAQENY